MKRCSSGHTLPESEFGRDRHQSDGLNGACRACVAAQRRDSRIRVKRKPSVMAPHSPLRSMSVKDRVIWAMERGAQTQEAIQEVAGIRDEDRLTDELATLWDEGKLDRRSLRFRVYRLAA